MEVEATRATVIPVDPRCRGRRPLGGPAVTRVALLAPLPPEVVRDRFPDVEVTVPDPDVVEACRGATVVVADWSGTHRVDADVVAVLDERCRLVQVPAAGLDSVDVDAIHAARIPLASCAGLNTTAVAEWCVWAAIDALRGFSAADRAVRAGAWPQLGVARYELTGRTVGIVGFGAIGQAVAGRLRSFDVDVRYATRTRRPAEVEAELGVTHAPLDELLPVAQVLVLACALTDETRGLLSSERIATLPHGTVVVNAARGEVVDEAALAAAVDDGRIHAVATDVFSQEPAPADHPLRGHDAVTTTPHVAGVSAEAVGRIIVRAFDNLAAALAGDPIEGLVPPA